MIILYNTVRYSKMWSTINIRKKIKEESEVVRKTIKDNAIKGMENVPFTVDLPVEVTIKRKY